MDSFLYKPRDHALPGEQAEPVSCVTRSKRRAHTAVWLARLLSGVFVTTINIHATDLSTPPSCANFLGLIYGLLAAAALWFSADRLPTWVNLYIVRFIAVACCLSALLDIRNDLFTFAPASGTFVNDAVALSRLTGLSPLVWANVWLIVSMWVLATFLTSALRGAD